MDAEQRLLVAGNWKMNGLKAAAAELRAIIAGAPALAGHADLLLCPPATLISSFAEIARGSPVRLGGQDCHPEPAGAFTGDISAEMLADAGATAVIVGHSERRTHYEESDATVQAKALAARRAGLAAIVCIGETKEQREEGRTLAVLERQLAGSLPGKAASGELIVAYEPVWAIGTGLTPTLTDVVQAHGFIRERLMALYGGAGSGMRILYGGSVKPANARDFLAIGDVDGVLVGGASLKAADFLGIAGASR